jgi:hypothetical protein
MEEYFNLHTPENISENTAIQPENAKIFSGKLRFLAVITETNNCKSI